MGMARSWMKDERFVPCIAAAVSLFFFCQAVVLSYSPIPFRDQWSLMRSAGIWAHFLNQWNDHKVYVSKLILIADLEFAHGTNIINLGTIYLMLLLLGLVLARFHPSREGRFGFWLRLFLIVPFMFSLTQLENLSWGFQHAFVAVFLFTASAIAAVTFIRDDVAKTALAIAASWAAVFSLSNGLLAPAFVFLAAVLARCSKRVLIALTLSGILAVVAFAWDYHVRGDGGSRISAFLFDPVGKLVFISKFMGVPVFKAGNVFAHLSFQHVTVGIIGACGLAFAVRLAWIAFRRRDIVSLNLLVMLAFTVATAALVSMGRHTIAGRYATPAMVFWACLILAALNVLSRKSVAIAVTAFSCFLAVAQYGFLPEAKQIGDKRRFAETAVLARVDDLQALRLVQFGRPERVLGWSDRLRRDHLSVFDNPWAGWLGSSLPGLVNGQVPDCRTEVTAVSAGDGLQVSGTGRRYRYVLANGDGKVVGYAYQYKDARWRGHAQPAAHLAAYGVVRKSDGLALVCP